MADPTTSETRLIELMDQMGVSNGKCVSMYKTPERRKSFVNDTSSYTKYLEDISHLESFDPEGVFLQTATETKKVGDVAIDVIIRKMERLAKDGRYIPKEAVVNLVNEAADYVEAVNRVI